MPNLPVAAPSSKIAAVKRDYHALEVAREYFVLGERPIPVCDLDHRFVSDNHRRGYTRPDGSKADACCHPGKAPLERDYGRFSNTVPTKGDLLRMFGKHRGNIGAVVPEGRIVIDIDPRNGGADSIVAYVREHGPLPVTPTVLTGGGGYHYYFLLPPETSVNVGGSLTLIDSAGWCAMFA